MIRESKHSRWVQLLPAVHGHLSHQLDPNGEGGGSDLRGDLAD